MQRKLLQMMLYIEEGMCQKSALSTIFYSTRQKPLKAEINRYAAALEFVQAEMEEYPIQKPIPAEPVTRQDLMKEKINTKLGKDLPRQLAILLLKLEKQLTYFDLENLSEVLPQLDLKERQRNRKNLQLISKKIEHSLRADKIREGHVLDLAERVLSELKQILMRKSYQVA